MAEGAGLENRYMHPHIAGSNPALFAKYPPVSPVLCSRGEVPERLNGHAWKACVGASSPQVRILSSPPFLLEIVLGHHSDHCLFSQVRFPGP